MSVGRPRRLRHQTHFQIGILDLVEYGWTRMSGQPQRQGSTTTTSSP
jgi:hypothetical protein